MALEKNLRAIYQAVNASQFDDLPLAADKSGTRLYFIGKGIGRLFSFLRNPAPEPAITYTYALFVQELDRMDKHRILYKDYLDKSGKGYRVQESDIFEARQQITQWYKRNGPFVKLMKSSTFSRLKPLLEKSFPECSGMKLHTLFAPEKAVELRGLKKIIDLEGVTAGPLPLSILKKIMRKKPLDESETKSLDAWIWKINKEDPSPRSVHKAFEFLAKLYQKENDRQDGKAALPYELEYFLQENGLKTFLREDPKHIEWRQGLKCGAEVPLGEETIILGKEIHSNGNESNKTSVFEVKDKPDKVAIVSYNAVVLPLQQVMMKHITHYGLHPALMTSIAPDGSVALMEKWRPLQGISWKSSNGVLSDDDAPIVNNIASFLASLVKYQATPKGFSSCLMLDANNRLKFLKPAEKGPFDFTALENFIFSCSGGNLTIFQNLMQKSGLARHSIALFYADLLASHLKGEKFETADLAAIHLISDPKVVDNGIAFLVKIQEIKDRLVQTERKRHPDIDPKTLNQKINQAIIACHRSYQSSGTVWPTLFQDVIPVIAT